MPRMEPFMGYSPLTNQVISTKKHSSRQNAKVTRLIVHHWAGKNAIDWVLNKFVYSTQKSSVNYIMRNTGHLIGSVDERYRAWTSNSYAADQPSITIEIENSTFGPKFEVSPASIEKLTLLLVDVAKRYGWKQIRFGYEVRGHREFFATNCPGPFLWPRLPAIAREANRRLQDSKSPKPPKVKDWLEMATKEEVQAAVKDALWAIDISIGGTTARTLDREQLSLVQLGRYGAAAWAEGREQYADIKARMAAQTAAIEALATVQGIDPEVVVATIDAAVASALEDLKVTLTVESDDV